LVYSTTTNISKRYW